MGNGRPLYVLRFNEGPDKWSFDLDFIKEQRANWAVAIGTAAVGDLYVYAYVSPDSMSSEESLVAILNDDLYLLDSYEVVPPWSSLDW